MASTLQRLRNQRLRQYVEAEAAILRGQSYTIGNRTLTKASLAQVREAIDDLLAAGATLDDCDTDGRGRRTRQVTLRDW